LKRYKNQEDPPFEVGWKAGDAGDLIPDPGVALQAKILEVETQGEKTIGLSKLHLSEGQVLAILS